MTHTVGIDIGSGAVKTVLFNDQEWLGKRVERIRRRDPMELAKLGFEETISDKGLKPEDISYVATTGEGENVKFATGHFYSMTTHARGGVFLNPDARAVVDIGALNGRAIYIDQRGKAYARRTTGPDSAGSRTIYYMHREVLRRLEPSPTKQHTLVDHINGHGLDNRRDNLRWVTPSENARNLHGIEFRQPMLVGGKWL